MAKPTKSENVPQNMQAFFSEIVQLTDAFCSEYQNLRIRPTRSFSYGSFMPEKTLAIEQR